MFNIFEDLIDIFARKGLLSIIQIWGISCFAAVTPASREDKEKDLSDSIIPPIYRSEKAGILLPAECICKDTALLMYVAYYGREHIFRLLIQEYGENPLKCNSSGKNALHCIGRSARFGIASDKSIASMLGSVVTFIACQEQRLLACPAAVVEDSAPYQEQRRILFELAEDEYPVDSYNTIVTELNLALEERRQRNACNNKID